MPQGRKTDNMANSPMNPEHLMLPGPSTRQDSLTMLGGKSVKLDGLGPMVVNIMSITYWIDVPVSYSLRSARE